MTTSATEQNYLHISPHGIPYRNLWYMLLYAFNEPPPLSFELSDDFEEAPTLDTLFCQILIKMVNRRLKIGLGRNYITQSQSIRGIRGTIDFGKTLNLYLLNKQQTHCTFQDFESDVQKNQIIKTTLLKMYKLGDFGPDRVFSAALRQQLRKLIYAMEGVSFIEINRKAFQRQQFGRNDRDYRVMLSICQLFIHKRMPSDSSGEIIINEISRNELRLFNVFELFVANFYDYHLHSWDVKHEKHFFWHEKQEDELLPIMKPDIFLSDKKNGNAIFLDTKFTKQTANNRWGSKSYHSGHLYQIYTYVKTQENHLNFHPRVSGILLYPLTNEKDRTRKIKLQDHNFVLACVDLTQDWNLIESQLMSLIPINS